MRANSSLLSSLVKGFLVGVAATEALDRISIYLYNHQSEKLIDQENEVRGGLHAYEKAADQLSRRVGVPLQRKDLEVWGSRIHKLLGYGGGIAYLALRKRYPKLASGGGLLFGSLFFLGVDEILVPALKLTPWAGQFPWQTHFRGGAAHLGYGVAAELTAKALDRIAA